MAKEKFGGLFVKADVTELIADDQVVFFKAVFERSEHFVGTGLPDLGNGRDTDVNKTV